MSTLHALLEQAAARRPDHVAVEDPERGTQITYGALDTLATAISAALRRVGVTEGDRVGLYAHKAIGGVAALFGALKAGAAYVPTDPLAPPARNAFIFQDCTVQAMIVEQALVEGLRGAFGELDLVAHELPAGVNAYGTDLVLLTAPGLTRNGPAVENLAYILYTSGSTGKPKGVMHTHASALSFVDWCSDTFAPTEDDRFSSHAPFHFDLSILDLYVPIKHAATLILIGEDLGKQPLRLAPVIAERRISMWYSTPSILRLLAEYGKMEQHDYSALRIVNFAGEVFPVKHLRAVKALWPHPRYFNLYGPTETNVCTFHEIPAEIPEDRTEPFPIGKTCANDRSLVMDEDDREVSPGEEGELYIAGGTVMAGYWNLPDRSARAFYIDPEGTRWYRTGDIVRQEADGTFIFIGRRDRMVKRRGYRIELGEIEAALYRHPSIKEAAVIAVPDEENGVLIKAFLGGLGTQRPSLIELKRFCAQNLPLYMIPDRFAFEPSLPKTSTDKIDYQSLKALA